MDAALSAPPKKRTRARYVVLALIAVGTMINYLDRSLLAVAAPSMSQDLALGAATMGVLFSAFSWSYALAQIPGGMFLDRFGVRLTYALSVGVWSVFTALQGAATGLISLIVYRLGLGAAEAPCFPANSRILVSWFPQQERARANSVYSVGMYFGIAFLSPVLFWVTGTFGWRALFIIAGVIGVLFALLWWQVYRDPEHSRMVNQAELDHIAAGGGGLGLFTAIRRLKAVYERLGPELARAGLPLYAQHVDPLEVGALVDVFRAERDSCLLGTDAVRDGVDVPGRSLRVLAFDRVPWPRPDLLHKARRERFGTGSGGRSWDDALARGRIAQAFGRLIRRADDRGVFVMLDAACPTRLFAALPPGTEVLRLGLAETVELTKGFLAEQTG